jgi:hypothetical protein
MRRCWVLPVLTWLVCATPAFAQTNLQLWANVTFDWVKSDRLTYELDLEPKVLLAAPEGDPAWRNLDLTPNVEYSWKHWLDLVGEATVGRTYQTDDGARYVLADWEYFIPLSETDERFASKQRIRAGFGYRRNLAWRFEVLYMWTRSRDTLEEGFRTDDNIIDIRIKRVF